MSSPTSPWAPSTAATWLSVWVIWPALQPTSDGALAQQAAIRAVTAKGRRINLCRRLTGEVLLRSCSRIDGQPHSDQGESYPSPRCSGPPGPPAAGLALSSHLVFAGLQWSHLELRERSVAR